MVQLNLALREINCKIVYFGPGLSGKTTNLEVVHERAPTDSRGELTSIATESDRTLFFDFMPLNLGMVGGMKTKFQLYTVPGQVYYNSTRKLVLRGADGVVFVADSAADKMEENIESLDNLEECLREQGRSLAEIPHVLQFNKRDLPNAMPMEEMERVLNRYGTSCFEGVASKGEGVIETFKALSGFVLEKVKAMAQERSSARPSLGTRNLPKPAPAAPRPASPTTTEIRPATDPGTREAMKPAASLPAEGRDPAGTPAVTAPAPRVSAPAAAASHASTATVTAATPRRDPTSGAVALAARPSARGPRSEGKTGGLERRSLTPLPTGSPRRATTTSQRLVLMGRTKRRRGMGAWWWLLAAGVVAGGAAFAYFQGIL